MWPYSVLLVISLNLLRNQVKKKREEGQFRKAQMIFSQTKVEEDNPNSYENQKKRKQEKRKMSNEQGGRLGGAIFSIGPCLQGNFSVGFLYQIEKL